MTEPDLTFTDDQLVVFLGHADDARELVEELKGLEGCLQEELFKYRELVREGRYGSIRLIDWRGHAAPLVGGQERVIHPLLARADVAAFVFRDRVGAVTWEELEGLRALGDQAPPMLAFFPERPFDEQTMTRVDSAAQWLELLERRQQLTAAWNQPDNRCLTPMEPYRDAGHLCALFEEKLGGVIRSLLYQEAERARAASGGGGGAAALPPEPAPPEARPVSLDDEIADYLRRLEGLHGSQWLTGFRNRVRAQVDIEELYVPLEAHVDTRAFADASFADASDAAQKLGGDHGVQAISLLDAFREADGRSRRGVVILGDPGSGKTTHLQRVLLWCARRGTAELGLDEDVVPVFVALRDLRPPAAGGENPEAGEATDDFAIFESFLAAQLDQRVLMMREGFGKRLLARGRLLYLLDGLDEVADPAMRARVSRWIEQAERAQPDCRFAVTCRFAGYTRDARLDGDFLELHLRPLKREQAEQFVRNWYRLVERSQAASPAQGEEIARVKAEALLTTLREDFRAARLVELTRNPLLLANLCLVHHARNVLPRLRVKLYEECIEVLLERWRAGKGLTSTLTAEDGRRLLQPAALWLHREDGRTRATAAELEPVVTKALATIKTESSRSAHEFLRAVRDESGLLTGWDHETYGFMHLGFQEYLAAREVRSRGFDDPELVQQLARRLDSSWWQEVCLLLLALEDPSLFVPFMREVVGQAFFDSGSPVIQACLDDAAEVSEVPFLELLQVRAPRKREEREGLWRRQLSALRILEQLESAELPALRQRFAGHESEPLRRWAQAQSDEAAQLAAGSDEVLHAPVGGYELVRIPAGSYLMGSPESDEESYSDERPQHRVEVPSFYLGRYPVTNEEYGRFLAANPEANEPDYWSDRSYNRPQQPVVGVSWEDAQAYCQWAGLRLPSEAEWEYACRAGTAEPRYDELDAIGWYDGNSDGALHPVGQKLPNAWGLHDMIGNVFEWVQDEWSDNYDDALPDGTARENTGAGYRVFRGGRWDYNALICRAAFRNRQLPGRRSQWLGFRPASDGLTLLHSDDR